MKGIILSGGNGTRLYPLTLAISKQLLPVYKYPMIFYPIHTLISMGIKDILIIVKEEQLQLYKKTILKYFSNINITFEIQNEPKGLAEAFIIAEKWLDGDDVTMILGDNVIINSMPIKSDPNTIFTFKVRTPEQYGVCTVDKNGNIDQIIEKPTDFVSDAAVVGLYIFKNYACNLAKHIKPSARGEVEIVDLIKVVDKIERVKVASLDGFWFDAGTPSGLLDCANVVRSIEERSNVRLFEGF